MVNTETGVDNGFSVGVEDRMVFIFSFRFDWPTFCIDETLGEFNITYKIDFHFSFLHSFLNKSLTKMYFSLVELL